MKFLDQLLPRDEILSLTSSTPSIGYKPSTDSQSLRAVVVTSSKNKFKEFKLQLQEGYGVELTQWDPAGIPCDSDASWGALCEKIMMESNPSPHFILREETALTAQCVDKTLVLTNLPLEEIAIRYPHESVLHTSLLTSTKPQWNDAKELTGFTVRQYEKRTRGYIKKIEKNANGQLSMPSCQYGFGWDALFVNSVSHLSNEELFKLYGKKSARQVVVSAFIENYLRYKSLKALAHHKMDLKKAINFGANYVSVSQFVKNEKHFSNAHIATWLTDRLRNKMIERGLFFKAALSRPIKNYFSPPFSGLPLTAKKDEAEETIFMTHDMLHHLVCDLLIDTATQRPVTKAEFNVYAAWRMMSEACTLVLADMFYADTLIKMGVARSCVDKRIYPLFEAIKSVQGVSNPDLLTQDQKIEFIRKHIYANIRYALLGDDSEWKKLLTKDDLIQEEHLARLEAYKAHFGKFFIGDNAWTRANFDNMQKNKHPLNAWIDYVGRDVFKQADVPLLSDVCNELKKKGSLTDQYEDTIAPLFNYLFESQLKPILESEAVALNNEAQMQSRAFRRFLIGQVSLFFRYPVVEPLRDIVDNIKQRLRDTADFTSKEQDGFTEQLKVYILGLEGLGYLSRDEALNAIDCVPVFPPVYISYPKMQDKYGTIAACIKHCIDSYQPPVSVAERSLFALQEHVGGMVATTNVGMAKTN